MSGKIPAVPGTGHHTSGTTFWQRHLICSALRRVATPKGRGKWEQRISTATPEQLASIEQELGVLIGYDGRVILRPKLVQEGRERAEALRQLAGGRAEELRKAARARLIMGEIEPFFTQLKFPCPRNKEKASGVMRGVAEAFRKIIADEPEAADGGSEALLGIILERRFKEELRGIFIGRVEMVEPFAKAFQDKLAALPPSIRNDYYLKALELIGISDRYPGMASEKRERVRTELGSILSYASAEQLSALGSEKARVALFFLFIFGQNELVGPRYAYFYYLTATRQDPAALIKEYHDLDLEQRLNLVAVEGPVPIGKRKSPLPLPDDRLYDPQKVIAAIDSGRVTKLIHIVREGKKRNFL